MLVDAYFEMPCFDLRSPVSSFFVFSFECFGLCATLSLCIMVCFWYCYELGADIIREIQDSQYYALSRYEILNPPEVEEKRQAINYSRGNFFPRTRKITLRPPSPPSSHSTDRMGQFPTLGHPCDHFAIPPPPPGDRRRPGPRRKLIFSLNFYFNYELKN